MTTAIRHILNKSAAFISGIWAVLPTFGGVVLLAVIVTAFVSLRGTAHGRMFQASSQATISLSFPKLAVARWPVPLKAVSFTKLAFIKRPVPLESVHDPSHRPVDGQPRGEEKFRGWLVYRRDKNYYRLVEIKSFFPVPASENRSAQHSQVSSKGSIATHLSRKKYQLYHLIIHEVTSRHQVDPALVKAIIMAESGFNPRAISKQGAKGLMQLMPGTAKALGVKDVFDPELNINAGVRYLKRLINRFNGDVKLALAAYNAGTRKVKEYQGIPPFKSTRFYIKKVLTYYEYFKQRSAGI